MYSFISAFAQTAVQEDINGDIKSLSIRAIGVASIILIVLLALAAITVKNKRLHNFKTPLFVMISSTIVLPSLLLVGSTVYVNVRSESNGPVHWHTDIEFWVCGEEIELRDPYAFLSNKIGTSTYHEHDDKRIHLEGVVFEKEYDASLEKFMAVTEGAIASDQIIIATEPQLFENDTDGDTPDGNQEAVRQLTALDGDGKTVIQAQNGDDCGDGRGPGEVQAFLMRFNDDGSDTYTQTKLENPKQYIMRDESIVPPGDCLIVEFDRPKQYSDRLCKEYGTRESDRCLEFGVTQYNEELCYLKQVRSQPETEPLPVQEPETEIEETETELDPVEEPIEEGTPLQDQNEAPALEEIGGDQ